MVKNNNSNIKTNLLVNEFNKPWIGGAFNGFLAIFSPSPNVGRETFSWDMTNSLELILSVIIR